MIKIMHVITTCGEAGAEIMLYRTLGEMDRTRFTNEVVTLTSHLELADKMRAVGVRVRSLHMSKTIPNPFLVARLAQWMYQSKPDVIHTWMYHSNLVGSLAARLVGKTPLIWAIHHGSLDLRADKWRTVLVNKVCAALSRSLASRVICCSEETLRIHKLHGYASEQLEVIPNGFDINRIKPDFEARVAVRDELGIPLDAPVIGLVARFHPQKDHRTFIQAAMRLNSRIPESRFLLCGRNVTWENTQLVNWIEEAGIRGRFSLLGIRQDTSRLFATMDVAATSSISEAFPLVIGEAMASGVPCVVTDVGDSAMIVGDTGKVVPPTDPEALAQALHSMIAMGPDARARLGMAARNRIKQHFSLSAVVRRYESIYTQIAGGEGSSPTPSLSSCENKHIHRSRLAASVPPLHQRQTAKCTPRF